MALLNFSKTYDGIKNKIGTAGYLQSTDLLFTEDGHIVTHGVDYIPWGSNGTIPIERLPITDSEHHNNKTLWTSETIFNKINNSFLANSAMRFKGSIGIEGKAYTINGVATPDGKLPKGEVGDTYRVSTMGSYGGNTCEVGDLLICYEKGATKEEDKWTVIQTNINGYSTFTINGTPYQLYTTDSTKNFKIYAPTSAGSANGQILLWKNGAAVWSDKSALQIGQYLKAGSGLKIGADATGYNGSEQKTINLLQATATTINELRQAFAIQRLYEKDARGGTRYRELLKAHFGVTAPDARVQVPEYLGGCRVPININQVLQTSSSDATSPQGNTAAYSCTTDSRSLFTSSFVEHGMLIGLACVRVEHSYCQGIERYWSRKRRFDFYWPTLANIGEQAVLKKEIFASGNAVADEQAFGYQEAWADYRYKPNRLSGEFSVVNSGPGGFSSSLGQAWTYMDVYSSAPTLSDSWIRESENNVAQTLATQDKPQFIADFYFKVGTVRPMPVYSVPGLIDHHKSKALL